MEYEYRIGDFGHGVALYYVPKGTAKEPISSMVAYKEWKKPVRLMGNYDMNRDFDAISKFRRIAIAHD